MSNVIDNRILEMKFDNDNFEKNVKQSLSSLENLNKSLDATETNGGMSKLAAGVENASSKFSALEAVAFGALANIGAKAADVGMNLVSSLSIDQLTAGWNKYEQKTTAVQTIMAATSETWQENADAIGFTGSQMEFVSEQLQRLNWFSDETSYSFSDMTNNIGKFTSNGVALTDAVEAMQGISSWAALSGGSPAEASRAMYNLAQAMSVGSVKLIDWKSIENANMATTEFKQTAIDTALALGTLVETEDGLITTTGGAEVSVTDFNSELSSGWFSADVLMQTLKKYGNFSVRLSKICDEYGTTASQFLSGMEDYKNGSKSISEIVDDLGMSISENDLISLFDELGESEYQLGQKAFRAAQEAKTFAEAIDATKDAVSTYWMNIFEKIFGNYEEAKVLWTDVANWLWDVFAGPLDNLSTLFDGWLEAGGRDRFVQGLYNLMDIITRVIDTVKEAFHDIFPEKTSKDLVNWTRQFMILTNRILNADEAFARIREILRGLFAVIDIGITIGKSIISIFKTVIEQLKPAGKGLLDLTSNVSYNLVKFSEWLKTSEKFKEGVQKVGNVLAKIVGFLVRLGSKVKSLFSLLKENGTLDKLKNTLSTIWGYITRLTDSIGKFFGKLTGNSPLKEAGEHVSIFAKALELIISLAGKLGPIFSKIGAGLGQFIKSGLDALSDFISNLDWNQVSEAISAGLGIAITKFVWGHSGEFNPVKDILELITKLGESVGKVFNGLTEALSSLTANVNAQTIWTIAKSVALLVGSLVVLAMIDEGKIYSGIAAIGALIGELVAAFEILTGADSQTFKQGVAGIMDAFSFSKKMSGVMKFAVAVGILSLSLKLLSSIEPDRLTMALAALSAVIWQMVAVVNVLSQNKSKILTGASAMIPFAIGVLILSTAIKVFSKMSWDELVKGLVGFTVVIGSVVGASIALSKTGSSMLKGAAGMIPFAIGVVILGAAFKIFASMSWDELGRSMLAFVGTLGVITGMTIALNKVSGNSALVAVGGGLIVFAIGVTVLGAAMKIFASLSWGDILKGGVALVGLLGVITGMTIALNKVAGNGALIAIGGGMVALAIGLAIMVPILKGLASMSWGDLAKAGVALAGLFGILVAAGYALKPVVLTLVKLAGALALIGLALVLAGAGLLMLGAGLSAIGASLGVIGSGLVALVTHVANLIPQIVSIIISFIEGLLGAIIGLIGKYAPQLMKAASIFIRTLCESLLESAPVIFDTIVQMLGMLVKYVPQIVEKVADLIIKIIDSLATKMPEFIQALFRFFQSMFGAVGELLGSMSLVEITTAIAELAGAALALAFVGNMGIAALKGAVILAGVIGIIGLIVTGLGALVTYVPDIKTFLSEGIPVLALIGQAIGEFTGNLIGGLMSGISNGLPAIGANLSLFMENLQPFLDGFSNVDSSVGDTALSVAAAILALTGAELLNGIANFFGASSGMEDLTNMLVPFGEAIVDFSNVVAGNIDSEAVESATNAGKIIAEMAKTLPNRGGVAGFFAGENDMDVFADKLEPFANAIVNFSSIVAGNVDTESVEAAANAGKMVAEMASELPNSGGVLGFFAGENDMDAFAAKMKPFANAIVTFSGIVAGNVNPEAIEAAANAGKTLTALADTIPNSGGVAGFLAGNNDMKDFAKQIVPFGVAMAAYSKVVTMDGGVDAEAVTASATAGKALAELYSSLPSTGGLWQLISGVPNMGKFKSDLVGLGVAIAAYSLAVSVGGNAINPMLVRQSITTAKALAGLYDNLPKVDGLRQKIAGTSSMTGFANDLSELGGAIAGYVNAVSSVENFDSGKVDVSTNAAVALSSLYNNLPSLNGLWDKISGVSDMSKFSEDLTKLGEALVGYVDAVSSSENMSTDKVQSSIDVVTALSGLYSVIDSTGGIFDIFTGVTDMQGFAKDLESLGEALGKYADSVKGKSFDDALASIPVITGLSDIALALPSDVSNFYQFGSNLDYVGECLSNFDENTAGVDSAKFSSVTTTFSRLVDIMNKFDSSNASAFGKALKDLGTSGVDDFIGAFENADPEAVKAAIDSYIGKIVDMLDATGGSRFHPSGEGAIKRFSDAISESDAADKAGEIGRNAAVALHALYNAYYEAGQWNMDGYISGMYSRSDSVYNMGYSLGQRAYDAAKAAVDSNSPSKKFAELGGYNAEGYALGMRQSFGIVDSAASDMGEVSMETIRNIIGGIASMIESDMDCNPTIRPVLDASEIQNGMDSVNGLFGNRAVSIGTVSGRLGQRVGVVSGTSASDISNITNSPVYNVNIDVHAAEGMNERDIAKEVSNQMKMEIYKREAVWA